jgi:hypothetical protein
MAFFMDSAWEANLFHRPAETGVGQVPRYGNSACLTHVPHALLNVLKRNVGSKTSFKCGCIAKYENVLFKEGKQ